MNTSSRPGFAKLMASPHHLLTVVAMPYYIMNIIVIGWRSTTQHSHVHIKSNNYVSIDIYVITYFASLILESRTNVTNHIMVGRAFVFTKEISYYSNCDDSTL